MHNIINKLYILTWPVIVLIIRLNFVTVTENVNSLDIIFSKTGFYDSHELNDDYSYLNDCLKDNGNIIRKQKKNSFFI